MPRTPGERLDTTGATARKQIEAVLSLNGVLKPVEEGFTNTVGGGAQAGDIRETEFATAPFARDDSQAVARSADGFFHARFLLPQSARAVDLQRHG